MGERLRGNARHREMQTRVRGTPSVPWLARACETRSGSVVSYPKPQNRSLLLLIASVAALAGMIGMSVYAFIRKGWWEGFRFLEAAAVLIAVYAVLLTGFSLTSSSPQLKPGEQQCFGDWCVAVSHTLYHDNKVYCTVRVDNRSATRDVQPARPQVLAVDSARRSFSPGYQSGQALEEPVGAGMGFAKTYTFALLPDSEKPMVEITNGPWYTVLMIGHPNSLFHAVPRTPVE